MKRIFIGCSSYNTIESKYFDLAKEVAFLCIKNNLSLVFGSRNEGMMRELYSVYKNSNMPVEAVTTKEYKKDLEGLVADKLILETTLKQIDYFLKCDILLFLPGGIGSLNELVNSITSKRNNETLAKIIIFNYENYYTDFINLLSKFEREGFASKENLFSIVKDLNELEKELM